MATPNRFIPTSLTAKNRPSWPARQLRKLITRIDPELYEQEQGITFDRYGIRKGVGGQFGEITTSNQFMIERPSGGSTIDPAKALANNRGFVYAAMNAIAREVMIIDWRLFQQDGDDRQEVAEHEVLDLLDTVNDSMISLVFKYLLSACQTLTGNAYIFLEGVNSELDKPKALHLMPPDRVRPVIDRRTWPFRLVGYKMKLENIEMAFKPYEVIQLQLPNPSDFFDGMSPVQAAADYIDNDNYAQEFNRKFFKNGARPAGFLESEFIAETQIEALKIGFMDMHGGIDNMNGIGVLPKGVKWAANGASPKDMDFKNLSEDSKERILAVMGASKTILGTAESDTNRATAETADYVFSKRVVKPHMLLICAFLTERLLPRYGDNLYLSFTDPVPEDRAARTTEMATASGGVPIITQNEARDEFMGLGPVEGGDVLLVPNTMSPSGAKQDDSDIDPNPDGGNQTASDKQMKVQKMNRMKAANGERVAFRPIRTKGQVRAKQRMAMANEFASKVADVVKEIFKNRTKKFSTKAFDEAAYKAATERTIEAEQEMAETIRRINAEQYKEVTDNLPGAIEKAVDPKKLFDLEHWIGITTDAMTPIIESLYESEGKTAAAELGQPELNPISDENAAKALHDSIAKMSDSYQNTVLTQLEKAINEGLSNGDSLADITSAVKEVYGAADDYGAQRIAKTEAFRTTNASLKETWKQSGVVHTIKWYTASSDPCVFCQSLEGKVISIDDNFLDEGETLTVDDKTMTADYGAIGSPPAHPQCYCVARPEDISI